MDAQERQLITGLFDRMRSHGAPEKDAAAADLIAREVRSIPDASYMLVQSVLVQEMALQQSDERIRELEARVEQLERGAQRQPAQGGGSFLGGLFGGGRQAEARPAATTSRSSMPGGLPQRGAAQASSPWGQQAPQPGGGGSFMRSAMATAAGVAGGMLLADGIRNMMNSGSGAAGTETASADTAADTSQTDYQDAASNDPGVSDADYGGDDFGGGDFGSMDI